MSEFPQKSRAVVVYMKLQQSWRDAFVENNWYCYFYIWINDRPIVVTKKSLDGRLGEILKALKRVPISDLKRHRGILQAETQIQRH